MEITGCMKCMCEMEISNHLDVYFCANCGWSPALEDAKNGNAGVRHAENVGILLSRGNKVATILIGPQKTPITCHNTLLGYFSSFFEAALYNGFAETIKNEVELPEEDNVDDVRCFVTGLYTGKVVSEDAMTLARLWVLGNRFLSPHFTSIVMDRLFSLWNDNEYTIDPAVVQFVLAKTFSESKLPMFFLDLVQAEGPLNTDNSSEFVQDLWLAEFKKRGDAVVDLLKAGGFHNWNPSKAPYKPQNQDLYLDQIDDRTAEDWRRGEF